MHLFWGGGGDLGTSSGEATDRNQWNTPRFNLPWCGFVNMELALWVHRTADCMFCNKKRPRHVFRIWWPLVVSA